MSAIRTNAKRRGWSFYHPNRVLDDAEILGLEGERGALYCAFWGRGSVVPRLSIVLPPDPSNSRAVRRWERSQQSAVTGAQFLELLHGDDGQGGLGLRVIEDDGPGRGLHVGWDPNHPSAVTRGHVNRRTGTRPSRRRGWRSRWQEGNPWGPL